MESLNIAGMMKNHYLARSLSDAAMAEFHRQVEYKMKWSGGIVVKAPRFYPSSKMCSTCGYTLDNLPLSVREWDCPACLTHHDRDQNAGENLRDYAVSSTVPACGEGSSGRSSATSVKLPSAKQEPNATIGLVVLNG